MKEAFLRVQEQLGLSVDEIAALVGVTRNSVYYQSRNPRSYNRGFLIRSVLRFVLANPPSAIITLLSQWTTDRPRDREQVEVLCRIARRHFDREAFPLWESAMREKHSEFF